MAAAKEPVKKKPKVSLSSIGMSFSNLEQAEHQKPSYYKEPEIKNKEEKCDFSAEELAKQWRGMCVRMEKNADLQGIAKRMKNITPTITTHTNIEVVVENRGLLDEITRLKGRIRVTLAQNLHNADIQINIRLAEQKDIKPKLTRRELFEKMKKENPAIARLSNLFNLDIA